jgi:hypothetical protein
VVAHLRNRFGVDPVLRMLGIAPSTFYGWLAQNRNPSTRRRTDQQLDEAQGQITIPAGAQRTVISPIVHRIDCPTGWAYGGAQVNYDSTGWSPVTESQTLWPDCQ